MVSNDKDPKLNPHLFPPENSTQLNQQLDAVMVRFFQVVQSYKPTVNLSYLSMDDFRELEDKLRKKMISNPGLTVADAAMIKMALYLKKWGLYDVIKGLAFEFSHLEDRHRERVENKLGLLYQGKRDEEQLYRGILKYLAPAEFLTLDYRDRLQELIEHLTDAEPGESVGLLLPRKSQKLAEFLRLAIDDYIDFVALLRVELDTNGLMTEEGQFTFEEFEFSDSDISELNSLFNAGILSSAKSYVKTRAEIKKMREEGRKDDDIDEDAVERVSEGLSIAESMVAIIAKYRKSESSE